MHVVGLMGTVEPANAPIHLHRFPLWIAFAPSGCRLILPQTNVLSLIAGIALGVEDAMDDR